MGNESTRLGKKYQKEIIPALMKKFDLKNIMEVPKIDKIVLNMGVGKHPDGNKKLEAVTADLTLIAGQKAVFTRAKQSVANFKLREGDLIGCKVTLRRERMFELLDRLISVAIPRIRDFRGLSNKAFDGRGSYSLGLNEQIVFPEVNMDRLNYIQGLNVAIVIRNSTDEMSLDLLRQFGFPFKI
ncbi:MAG: 50S ribosomal protein L5 [Planctomycetota bacterium]